MKIKAILLSLLLSTPCFAISNVELNEDTVSLTDEVSSQSVSNTILAIEGSKAEEIILFIDSPGGSVIDGLVLVNYLKATKKNIKCLAKYAASMAHAILEACPSRLGTTDNILMQHKMSINNIGGTLTEIEGSLVIMRGLENILDTMESDRIGLSIEEFRNRTSKPWYTFGTDSLRENVIDKLVTVTCKPSLYLKKDSKTVSTMFGRVEVIKNGCPLIPVVIKPVEDH